jgi:hypothetical protein
MQVGYVGLVKAINNFDPADGDSLSAYAAPCVSGEVKRYFWDKRWQVHSAPSSARHREEGDLSPLAGCAPFRRAPDLGDVSLPTDRLRMRLARDKAGSGVHLAR